MKNAVDDVLKILIPPYTSINQNPKDYSEKWHNNHD